MSQEFEPRRFDSGEMALYCYIICSSNIKLSYLASFASKVDKLVDRLAVMKKRKGPGSLIREREPGVEMAIGLLHPPR